MPVNSGHGHIEPQYAYSQQDLLHTKVRVLLCLQVSYLDRSDPIAAHIHDIVVFFCNIAPVTIGRIQQP